MQRDGCLGEAGAVPHVAAYVAASERVENLSAGEVIDIVRQGLDADVAANNLSAVRDLARDVLLKRAHE